MKIGIIGTGKVATALAVGFARNGHDVMVGSREPEGVRVKKILAKAGRSVRAGTRKEAVEFGKVIVIAVGVSALGETIDAVGPSVFDGKIVIDPVNSVAVTTEGPSPIFDESTSSSEYLQKMVPGAHVVKAFNQIEADRMADPKPGPGKKPVLRICGDNKSAKKTVGDLAGEFGWAINDTGDLSQARELERAALKLVLEGKEIA